MWNKIGLIAALSLILSVAATLLPARPLMAAEPSTTLELIKYAVDGETVIGYQTVDYQWMKDNLPPHGDGVTHYYHQGPIFEGDVWDVEEVNNLKDKGAVMGTDVRDLCELIGGMSPGEEIRFSAADGWHTEFGYANIYEPLDRQGPIVLCWYNGEDALSGERYGEGYPGKSGYHTAMQMVFMAGTTNPKGKYVFGNEDMRVCLSEEKYQHFYEGLPSTNGLSGKWISRIEIFSDEPVPAGTVTTLADITGSEPGPALSDNNTGESSRPPGWVIGLIAAVGATLIVVTLYRNRRKGGVATTDK